MEVKRIKCPKCGVVLVVKNTKNEALKSIICPKCKTKLKVPFKQTNNGETQLECYPNSGETQLGSNHNNGETQLGSFQSSGETQLSPIKNEPQTTASLRIDGKNYQLQVGVNIIGRKASTSLATIQIETSDRYMSRQHAKIVVSKMPDGKLKAIISNDRNKNITTIDGQDLLQGEAIVLTDGDRIVMGKTTVTYVEH